MQSMRAYFRKQIALPQDHGSWVFILSPLLVGMFAGATFNGASFTVAAAALLAFLIRQPITMAIKAYAGRRPLADLPIARAWILGYGLLLILTVLMLLRLNLVFILYLAVPAAPVFGWHLWLVSRREERRQPGIEIVATGVLALAAPAAYWAGASRYDPTGWWLWILVWMQSAASIVYAYLRLEQREWASSPDRRTRFRIGWRAWLYTTFNLASVLGLGLASWIPSLLYLPYLVQWFETVWGIDHPATGWKPTRIGIRQLIVSTLWTILFILCWRR
jgi:hypothetical protein